MNPPKLVQRYSFQKREEKPIDDLGNVEDDWVEQFQTRASRKWMRGGEQVLASRLSGVQPAIITVRLNPDTSKICSFWRCVDQYTGEGYNIMTVEPSENRQYIDLLIQSGVAHG